MDNKLRELKRLLQEAYDLDAVNSVLGWDQKTFMPKGGGAARGRQSALMAGLAHRKATDPTIGKLLDELRAYGESLPYEHDDAAILRTARRQYERLVKVPAEFVAQMTEHQAAVYETWVEARQEKNWSLVESPLEKTLDLSRQLANFFPGYQHIADPLIDMADYGMTASEVRQVFSSLRERLVPLLQKISAQPQIDNSVLNRHYPQDGQLAFSEEVIRAFGYDYDRGRMDLTMHPFTTMFSIGDVRITVRVQENDLGDCMFSAFHEAGHAMHVMGCNPAYEATPLSSFVSAGLAESQSRTWENLVGRSRSFWEYFYPRLQTYFPEQLAGVDLDHFYRAVNKVEPSFIRTDADEVTYNLHPLIRFDLELALLEGNLAVKDLPQAWNERYTSDLGITPPHDSIGVLQDVHWYAGYIGGVFQGYTLGNLMSAMFHEQALQEHPEITSEMKQGKFDTLHTWLKEKIYWHGAKYTANEVIERVTGKKLEVDPLIRYFENKYRDIYSY